MRDDVIKQSGTTDGTIRHVLPTHALDQKILHQNKFCCFRKDLRFVFFDPQDLASRPGSDHIGYASALVDLFAQHCLQMLTLLASTIIQPHQGITQRHPI
ncbi:hypothetical protein SDC9_104076 [bioreactor metagenome]|uniref:Uncharacterized protein n=1 Tax=bioreactor metagenome TaxID=1076179 RepID=A0A645B6A7_9ZZZZ